VPIPPSPAPIPPLEASAKAISGSARDGVRAFSEGDYQRAAVFFRKALADEPENPVLKNNLAQSLSALGWQEFEKADYSRSEELFNQAFELKSDPAFLKGVLYSQVRLDKQKEAEKTFEGISGDREARSALKGLFLRLGQRQYKSGNMDDAVGYFEKALSLDPSDTALSAAVENIRSDRKSEEGFGEKKGSHFTVRFAEKEDVVTGHLIGLLLEEAYYKIGAEIGYYPEDKITAVLYPGERFRDITMAPSWAGALYDGKIKIPSGGITERTALLEKVIFHEYTHAVVRGISKGRAPVWLNEGLAQYLEGKRVAKDYRMALKDAIPSSGSISLKQFEGSFTGLTEKEAYFAYALSLSATEYLIREFGIFSAKKILEGVSDGDTLDEAFSSSIYQSFGQFEDGWYRYLKRDSPSG